MIRPHRPACRPVHVRRVASQAKEVDVVYLQQPRVGRAMRRVAGEASLISFDRRVLEDEWPHRVGVTSGAYRKLSRGGADLVTSLGPMRVVTITALNQSHFHPMTIRPSKLSLLRRVAAEAKLGLRLHEHEIHIGGFVRIMAASAGYAAGKMLGLRKVLRLQAGLMAADADGSGLCGTQRFKADDFGNVAAAVDVRLSWSVTGLAPMLIALQQCRMRSACEMFLPEFLMASLADIVFCVLLAGCAGKCGRFLRRGATRLSGTGEARQGGGNHKQEEKAPQSSVHRELPITGVSSSYESGDGRWRRNLMPSSPRLRLREKLAIAFWSKPHA